MLRPKSPGKPAAKRRLIEIIINFMRLMFDQLHDDDRWWVWYLIKIIINFMRLVFDQDGEWSLMSLIFIQDYDQFHNHVDEVGVWSILWWSLISLMFGQDYYQFHVDHWLVWCLINFMITAMISDIWYLISDITWRICSSSLQQGSRLRSAQTTEIVILE